MGIFGFVAAGGGSIGVLLGGILTDVLNWHWIFLVNVPVGVAVVVLSLLLIPAARVPAAAQRLDVAGAITVTASLMIAVFAIVNGNEVGWTSARTLGLLAVSRRAARDVPRDRGQSGVAAGAARPLPPPERRGVECRRRPLGGRDVRVVLPFGPLSAAGARVQPAPGRSRLPPGQPDHGRVLDRPVREARHALRAQAAARDGARAGRDRPAALRAGSGRRKRARRRAPGHDPARSRRGDGVQPGAPRRHERRQAGGGRARLRCRQHRRS